MTKQRGQVLNTVSVISEVCSLYSETTQKIKTGHHIEVQFSGLKETFLEMEYKQEKGVMERALH